MNEEEMIEEFENQIKVLDYASGMILIEKNVSSNNERVEGINRIRYNIVEQDKKRRLTDAINYLELKSHVLTLEQVDALAKNIYNFLEYIGD